MDTHLQSSSAGSIGKEDGAAGDLIVLYIALYTVWTAGLL